jgi:hypothetical protein
VSFAKYVVKSLGCLVFRDGGSTNVNYVTNIHSCNHGFLWCLFLLVFLFQGLYNSLKSANCYEYICDTVI